MEVQELLSGARDVVSVKRVYGEPYEKNGLTVIPAATVRGGGGVGMGDTERGESGQGGGFGLIARPSGAWIIEDGRVTWRPAIDVNRIILGGQVIALTRSSSPGGFCSPVRSAVTRCSSWPRTFACCVNCNDAYRWSPATSRGSRPGLVPAPRSENNPADAFAPGGPYDRGVIGIALLTLVPGELGGSETYARELLRALARGGELDYRVLLPPVASDSAGGLPSEVATEYREARTIPQRLAAMTLATARPGPLRARLAAADVVHYPLTLRIPTVRKPSVVTLLDLQHLDLPSLFSRGERAFRSVAWHRSVRGADRVIVISAFVRDRAVEFLGLDPGRVRVIHLGIDHDRFKPGVETAPEPFLLYPARRWPHKNHERLFEAFALLRHELPWLRLVLTGGGHSGAVPDGVEVRGLVPEDELVGLYRSAAALVFPSLYEGFGQPVLEAMACGCPVACSNVASLPEVVGDAAPLFDPNDAIAMANAVLDVLAAPEEWSARGLERAKLFSWEATARAHDAVYRELSDQYP